jgi:hypothetical protein
VRNWGRVDNRANPKPSRSNRAKRSLTPRASATHKHIDFAHPIVVHCVLRSALSRNACSEGRAFARASKSNCPWRQPAQYVALRVSNSDDRVVEGRLDVYATAWHIAPDTTRTTAASLLLSSCAFSHETSCVPLCFE